ncbi:LON peptidase substrate-binding domain-containing protein [Limibacillus halophilus]
MTEDPFDPTFDELPQSLPIFPLAGALLLPRAQLPLNIFEPRYLAMVDFALKGERMIGMILPREDVTGITMGGSPVYPLGCAGRIVSFAETDDGRYLITLKGLIRFDVKDELPIEQGFRRVTADFAPYRADLEQPEVEEDFFDRQRLLANLKRYFEAEGITADWEAIEEAPGERLITSLSMACPFDSLEKQALLQAPDNTARAETLIRLLEMAGGEEQGRGRAH